MKIARSAVVTQSGPQAHDVFFRSLGQIVNSRKGLQKTGKVVPDDRYLRLLKHDFAQPSTVWVARKPRQILAALFALPRAEPAGKFFRIHEKFHFFWHFGQK